MKQILYNTLTILLSLNLISCLSNEIENPRFFSGNHNLNLITMDSSLDINGDGESSTDFLTQIQSLNVNENRILSLVNADNPQIFFSAYVSNILTVQDNVPIIQFALENINLITNFNESNDEFEILDQGPTVRSSNEIVLVKLVNRSTIEITLKKSLYDHISNDFVDTMVIYQYVRGEVSS